MSEIVNQRLQKIANTRPSPLALRLQIRRAVVSIPSNIAEGDERETDKEAVRYFYIAKGSSAEVLTQATIYYL